VWALKIVLVIIDTAHRLHDVSLVTRIGLELCPGLLEELRRDRDFARGLKNSHPRIESLS
jgi:hypothetical protein